MTAYDYDLGIIGAGAAGLTLTAGAAQMGAKTILIEGREKLGGDCLHFGCVPSKTLIQTAHVYQQMKSGPKFGLPELEPPLVDFSRITSRIQKVIDTIQKHDSVERFCRLGAKIEFGWAEFLDEHSLRLEGKNISAQKWAIAAGSRPAVPEIKGLDRVDYLTNEDIFYMQTLPEEMIIMGGGPVAIEMAQALKRLGCQITLLQRSVQVLSKEDKDMADLVLDVLKSEGVHAYTGLSFIEVRQERNKKIVLAKDGQGIECIFEAPALFVALGRQPNVDTLRLEKAGVDFHNNGIPVDNKMRTNRAHIYAIGDVIGKYQFTHAAGYEGGVALSNAIIHLPKKADYTWMPRATYTDPEFAALGKTESQLQAEGLDYSVWTKSFMDNDRSLTQGYETGKIKLLMDGREKVLGVQIIGPSAGELLAEWSAVLNGQLRLSTLASAVHPYPTLAEINKGIAGDIMAPKLFDGLLKKGVDLLFNYKGRACDLGSDEDI